MPCGRQILRQMLCEWEGNTRLRLDHTLPAPTDRYKIAVPINGVELQWEPVDVADGAPPSAPRCLHLTLRNSMPWFDHYEVTMNSNKWLTADSV